MPYTVHIMYMYTIIIQGLQGHSLQKARLPATASGHPNRQGGSHPPHASQRGPQPAGPGPRLQPRRQRVARLCTGAGAGVVSIGRGQSHTS